MKHLLRKLHIGGSVTEHQSRLGETRQTNSPSPSPSPSQSPSSVPSSPNLPPASANQETRGTNVAERTTSRVDHGDSSANFNFFEEEFQVQLALAISASDPDARGDQESAQINAAKKLSLGCSPSGAFESLSLRYWSNNVVNYEEEVMDGFYDVYRINPNSIMQGKMPLLADLQATPISANVDYEVILVNRIVDPALRQLERRVESLAVECRASEIGPVVSGLVQKIADLVVNAMGGPVGDADEMLIKWKVRSYELRSMLNTIILPLGCLNVGLSRHRALLFKVLADRINLPCRLVKGSYYTGTDDGAVNLIKIDYSSEYIIDLMGAPGTLIPAEIPSTHLQNFGSDVMSSLTFENTGKDSCLALDKVSHQAENKTGKSGGDLLDLAPRGGGSESNEAAVVGFQSKGNGMNLVKANQTERFEHEFGKLLPSLRRSHESSPGTSGKSSPAQRLQLKDVSKYVISAAQNPEFAQKLHAVLLESCSSGSSNIFADIAPPWDLGEQKGLVQSCSEEGEKMDRGSQQHCNKISSCTEHSVVPCSGLEFLNQVGCENKQKHSDRKMAEKRKEDESAYSNLIFDVPISSSSSTEKPGLESTDLNFGGERNVIGQADSCQRRLENPWTGGAQCSQGNAGRNARKLETGGIICLPEYQERTKGSMMKFVETYNHDQHIPSYSHNESINLMFDEVAEWEIPWEDIQIAERIGLGSYGEVYRADWNGTEVAVKKFLDQDFSGDALEQLRCEVGIMQRLRHPNVVLFMGAVTRPPNLSILTEFLPRGSLCKLLHRPNNHLDEKRRLRMALDVAKGMNYLHTCNPVIVHRDLKSPNLLVDKNWIVKVCDFGLSRLKHHTFLSSKSMAGTAEWMAPEVLRNEPSNEKCDVFSFGVILWELATLKTPWTGMNSMQVVGAVGFQNRRLEIPEEIDPVVAQIIRDCWQSEPNLRPSFSELMSILKRLHCLVVENR